MNTTEHLLVCLAEECDEVAKEASKALRFGLDDQVTMNPLGPRGTNGPTNREKIIDELNDLMGIVDILIANEIIPRDWQNEAKSDAKAKKVTAFMQYARNVGALTD